MDNVENIILYALAGQGRLDAVKLRIEKNGADPTFTTPDGSSVLHAALQGGHLEVVKYLIDERNVSIGSVTEVMGVGIPALFAAARYGHLHIVKYLVEIKGEDVLHEICGGYTVVFAAAVSGNVELLQYFVSKNCSMKCTDDTGETPLHHAARSPADRADAVAYLIDECGCDPLNPTNHGSTSLHVACQEGRINIVKYLVEMKNCDPLQAYAHNRSPLHLACATDHIHVVKYIVDERKMDPRNAQSILGHPCFVAAFHGCRRVVKYFIENGHLELTEICILGENIAQIAMLGDKIEILKYLIEERGFDPMTVDLKGRTLLQHAQEISHMAGKCYEYLKNTYSKNADHHVLPQFPPEAVEQNRPPFFQGQ